MTICLRGACLVWGPAQKAPAAFQGGRQGRCQRLEVSEARTKEPQGYFGSCVVAYTHTYVYIYIYVYRYLRTHMHVYIYTSV